MTVKMNKYHNIKTEVDGYLFDSRREAERWSELCLLEKAEEITNIERQVKFEINVNDKHVCNYFADFVYQEHGRKVIEDVKSGPTRTKEYRIKKRLVEAMYNIKITEVE